MRRVMVCVLSSCVVASFATLGSPATADGFAAAAQREAPAWYTSDCCYRKIVRNGTAVRYARVERSYRPYRAGYDRSYRYNRRWRYGPPPYGPGYGTWLGGGWTYANYQPPPDCRLVRLTDGMGGWIWARRAGCL